MFVLALVYLFLWLGLAVWYPEWRGPNGPYPARLIAVIMFGIIGFVLFWDKLNR